MTTYKVAEDFAEDLGGRFREDGDFSGEEFRDDVLLPLVQIALTTNSPLIINFDGVTGMPTSFLEEAFGGLLRKYPQLPADRVLQLLRIEAPRSQRLWGYVRFAQDVLARASRARSAT